MSEDMKQPTRYALARGNGDPYLQYESGFGTERYDLKRISDWYVHADEYAVLADKCARLEADVLHLQPAAFVLPGDYDVRGDGWIDAKAWQDGEFSKPLYDLAALRARLEGEK